jgi:proteasome accessory factor B
MTQPTKLQRWLDLIACLVGRNFPVATEDLWDCVPAYKKAAAGGGKTSHESTRRMFERDKDELRAAGIPIRSITYQVNGEETEGYQIDKRDFYLPYLRLVKQLGAEGTAYKDRHRIATMSIAEEEAPLALDALRRVAEIPGFPLVKESRSAFRKLAFALDAQAFSAKTPVLFVDTPGAAELTAKVRILSDALASKKRVSFEYHGIYRGETTQRDVAGYGLMFQQGHWYLVGHDATRDAMRVFRVGRMDTIVANKSKPGTPDYAVPADFKLTSYAEREPWQLGENDEKPLVADVLFHFPLSLWADRNERGALIEKNENGSHMRRFALHQVEPFLRWILSLEGEAEIVSPESLRTEFRKMAIAVANAHRAGGA